MNKRSLGAVGESAAIEYLKKHKYEIVETNYYTRFGEIDVIAKKDEAIVFIEVKARRSHDYGYPSESVNKTKKRRIVMGAKYYLFRNNISDTCCSFDVIEVNLNNYYINHIENAF